MKWILFCMGMLLFMASGAHAIGDRNGEPIEYNYAQNEIVLSFANPNNDDWATLYSDHSDIIMSNSAGPITIGFFRVKLKNEVTLASAWDKLKKDKSLSFVNPALDVGGDRNGYATDRIFVAFCSDYRSSLDSIMLKYNLTSLFSMFNDTLIRVLRMSDGKTYNPYELANELITSGAARFAKPDLHLPMDQYMVPNDEHYPNQYHLDSLDMPLVWDLTIPNDQIVIAVLDQGLETHEDIDSLTWVIDSAAWTDGKDYVSIPADDSIPEEDESPPDSCSFCYHGMAVAGVIAASTNNDSLGVASIAGRDGIKIMGQEIRAIFGPPSGLELVATVATMARAITHAIDSGNASILNFSWGYNVLKFVPEVDLIPIATALQIAADNGVLIVCSSGNYCDDTIPNCTILGYPAWDSNSIAVGALDIYDTIADFSTGGPNLDLVAYGDYIYTIDREEGGALTKADNTILGVPENYNPAFGGTSAAAPMVSATAALILQRRPDLRGEVDSLKRILRYSCENPYSATEDTARMDDRHGWGRLNTFRALLSVIRGDANNDGLVGVGDAVYLVNFILRGGAAPFPDIRMGDANCDGNTDTGDTVYIINYVFNEGPRPGICFEY